MGKRSRSRSRSKHESKRHHKISKKHKKRASSSSSDEVVALSSSSFDQRLEQIRINKQKLIEAEKRKMKERETPEEKRARRIAKKLQKDEKRKALIQNVLPETIPYTDTNNPFNDNNLTDVFVWNKKLQTEGKSNLSKKQIEKMSRDRIVRNVAEMEELKRNRDARQSMKEDMEMINREQEMKQHSDWRKTEDHFHLNQAKVRSKLRIREGRAKPVDLLARYIAYTGEDDEDLDDLVADIKVYKVLDGRKNDNFWNDITAIAQSELKKIERRKSENVHSTIQDDVQKVFKVCSLICTVIVESETIFDWSRKKC
uniref:Splicing factor cactin central domain-containing protein n=1 Tax=Ditylenchus dipsaci TaxID=166011 RepID=A0A915EDZ9_9BILA